MREVVTADKRQDAGGGFTLIEIIVVMLIVGILATLGLTQYTKVVEKGRTTEARSILGAIRTLQETYKLENGVYTSDITKLPLDVPIGDTGICLAGSAFFFHYKIDAGATATDFKARATRCTTLGKAPPAVTGYDITIDQDGIWGGTF